MGSTPLHRAANADKLEAVRLLLHEHCRVDSVDNAWRTPLHYASASGHLEMAKFLVSAGATPSLQGFDGRTAKELALARGKNDVAKYLAAYDLSPMGRATRATRSVWAWLSVAVAIISSWALAPFFARTAGTLDAELSPAAQLLASTSSVPAGWNFYAYLLVVDSCGQHCLGRPLDGTRLSMFISDC